ncbi:MAG: hypothetical protein MUC29_13410 [Pyrinomonadaceae bacterium]|jgi:hypothetical protein|nr:hypothetical protein [Pyrinomonadaceae bacterium]
MLTTVEAEIDVNGNVRLLEPLSLSKPSRAIVTILEESNGNGKHRENNILEFLQNNRLPDNARPSIEEIEAQIKENKDS